MKLIDAIQKIQYDNSWGIWADVPFTPDSNARFGQSIFENGGLLDDKQFFADGVTCGEYMRDYLDGASIEEFGDEAASEMILDYESTREQFVDYGEEN